MALTDKLTAIADAIRAKTGGTEELTLDQMPTEIEGISTGEDTFEAWLLDTLTNYENGNATKLESYSFYNRFNIQSVSFPSVKTLGTYVFYECTALKSVNFPVATTIGSYGFSRCSSLESVNLPKLTSAGTYLFRGCESMIIADFGSLASIGSDVFYGCTNLKTLILRKDDVCKLSNTNSFTSTPFASGGTGGTVYVPSALIASYQAANNWKTLYDAGTCNFVAIEGSAYE